MILAHNLCLLVKPLKRLQPFFRLWSFRFSSTACLDGHIVQSLTSRTRPSTETLGSCCVVAAERGMPASRSRSNVLISRCVLLCGALTLSIERRASGCL